MKNTQEVSKPQKFQDCCPGELQGQRTVLSFPLSTQWQHQALAAHLKAADLLKTTPQVQAVSPKLPKTICLVLQLQRHVVSGLPQCWCSPKP